MRHQRFLHVALLMLLVLWPLSAQWNTNTGRGVAHNTLANCSDSAGDAACGAARAGAVVVDAGDTDTIVSTTAVTANSEVFVQYVQYTGTRLSVTCNTTAALPTVTSVTAGTSFTFIIPAAPVTNPACYVFWIVN
jgi:hypothetical protein